VHETEVPVDDPSVAPSTGDPEATHIVVRSTDRSGPSDLTRQRRGMLTSLSVLLTGGGDAVAEQVRQVTDWAPPQFRVEFELVAGPEDPEVMAIADRLDELAFAWSVLSPPAGGRGPALDHASAESTGEFVVIPGGGDVPVDALSDALGLMWVNGADALVIAAGSGAGPDVSADVPADVPADIDAATAGQDRRAERLGVALGLRRGEDRPAVVVLRRWVARFLFDDLGRAIDPIEEFAERVGLLELRLLEVLLDA
jgi:hypothetical protein